MVAYACTYHMHTHSSARWNLTVYSPAFNRQVLPTIWKFCHESTQLRNKSSLTRFFYLWTVPTSVDGLIIDYRPTTCSFVNCSWLFFATSQWMHIQSSISTRGTKNFFGWLVGDCANCFPSEQVSGHIDPFVIYVFIYVFMFGLILSLWPFKSLFDMSICLVVMDGLDSPVRVSMRYIIRFEHNEFA